jgi:hypothetical protein
MKSNEDQYMTKVVWCLCAWATFAVAMADAEPIDTTWKIVRRGEHEQNPPRDLPGDAKDVKLKYKWRSGNDFYWLIADLTIPTTIDGKATAGRPVGMQFSCAAGGDIYIDGALQCRYDNDHPGLALIAESAEPGRKVRVAVQAYGNLGAEGDNEFSEANWVVLDPQRARRPLTIRVDPQKTLGPMPNGLIGLSQGAGMCDYEDATAAKLREAGFKWFRMDNVFTGAVKSTQGGGYAYDFTDLERRIQFMHMIGAEPILCVSYMPQAFDAVPDPERHSAPKDYGLWEDLCYRAARHLREHGMPVKWWEVWNETNAGWIKPGPNDTGSPEFAKLYAAALGKPAENKDDVRLLEAYLKLYTATARGVLRGDRRAKIGGPCLASGPFERSPDRNYAVRGKVFARALMMYCQEHKLPLDFISWHEYFHPAEVFVEEARTFRKYLDEFPAIRKQIQSFMLTEWSFSWWPDRPQDHEMGAAWCADCMIRAILPEHIDRPCFFYVKDNDANLRGSWALIIKDNVPKPVYNMCRMFNRMSGSQIAVTGTDDEVAALASWDPARRRLCVIVANFRYRYNLRRHVRVDLASLPPALRDGAWTRTLIDPTHSNVWYDRSRAELETVAGGDVARTPLSFDMTLLPNSVTMIEIAEAKR